MASEDYVYVDSELLIFEVQKRPLLYDISLPDYNDRVKKAKCWDEVCEQVIQNWDDLSPAEKNNRARDIQKRWRSIRDSFMKAYRKWKNVPSGASSVKGKRYVYFKQMMFMIPSIEKRWNFEKNSDVKIETIERPEDTKRETPEKHMETYEAFDDDNEDDLQPTDPHIYEPVIEITPARKRLRKEYCDSDILRTLLKRHREPPEEDDEDKMFLLSLLPSFKKMDEDVKFATRIEILQVVRRNLQTHFFPTPAPSALV